VRFRSSRGREGCRERAERERVSVDRNFCHLPLLRRRSSSLAARGMDGVHRWGALGGEERGWEKNGVQGRGLVGSEGFIPRRWARCVVVSTVSDWAAGRCFLDGVVSCVHV
jgi:hypothetical protein